MFADTSLFLFWLIVAGLSYWMIPPAKPRWRQCWLIATSWLLIFAIAPWACLFVTWMWLGVWVATRVFEKVHNPIMLSLILLAICLPLLMQRSVSSDVGLIASLGITFATLRAVAMSIDGYVTRKPLATADAGVCLFFLPLYTVGPIESVQKFSREQFAIQPDFRFMARGLSRIALGLFKTVFVADILIAGQLKLHFPVAGRSFGDYGSPEMIAFIGLSFLYTYVNFSGVVDIALGTSRLFGLRIIENFDFPIVARNLRDFWKRWHISLGRWITQYLYFPVVASLRTPVSPYVATFLAFVLIGWWHGATLTYLSWGVFHGAGLCAVMFWQRSMKIRLPRTYKILTKNPLYILVSWSMTIVYVAWVQTFANQNSFAEALSMTRALIGA